MSKKINLKKEEEEEGKKEREKKERNKKERERERGKKRNPPMSLNSADQGEADGRLGLVLAAGAASSPREPLVSMVEPPLGASGAASGAGRRARR